VRGAHHTAGVVRRPAGPALDGSLALTAVGGEEMTDDRATNGYRTA
jgi:hypothetical protein